MPTFQFLSPSELKKNSIDLVKEVNHFHIEKQTQTNPNRQDQLARINMMIKKISLFIGLNDDELLKNHHSTILDYSHRLKKIAHDQASDTASEIKELESKKYALYLLINKMIKIDSINNTDEPSSWIPAADQLSRIMTGLLLTIKQEIEYEYSGVSNKIIGVFVNNTPDNSKLYKKIDTIIGITENNQLDEESKNSALAAYKNFLDDPANKFIDRVFSLSIEYKLKGFNESSIRSLLKQTKTIEKIPAFNENVIRDANPDEKMKYDRHRELYPIRDKNRVAGSWRSITEVAPSLTSRDGFFSSPNPMEATQDNDTPALSVHLKTTAS